MKRSMLLSVAVPFVLALAAAAWTPLSLWYDMKEGLIAFLGFLAASLVQVMPITANFIQSDRLNPTEAERLTRSLTKQQHYWIGLLCATIAAMVFVVVGAALKDRVTGLEPLFLHRLFLDVSWSAVVVFFLTFGVCFVLVRMLGLFTGMLALHHLRGELVINAAKRSAIEQIAVHLEEARPTAPLVPKDYGQIIRPH